MLRITLLIYAIAIIYTFISPYLLAEAGKWKKGGDASKFSSLPPLGSIAEEDPDGNEAPPTSSQREIYPKPELPADPRPILNLNIKRPQKTGQQQKTPQSADDEMKQASLHSSAGGSSAPLGDSNDNNKPLITMGSSGKARTQQQQQQQAAYDGIMQESPSHLSTSGGSSASGDSNDEYGDSLITRGPKIKAAAQQQQQQWPQQQQQQHPQQHLGVSPGGELELIVSAAAQELQQHCRKPSAFFTDLIIRQGGQEADFQVIHSESCVTKWLMSESPSETPEFQRLKQLTDGRISMRQWIEEMDSNLVANNAVDYTEDDFDTPLLDGQDGWYTVYAAFHSLMSLDYAFYDFFDYDEKNNVRVLNCPANDRELVRILNLKWQPQFERLVYAIFALGDNSIPLGELAEKRLSEFLKAFTYDTCSLSAPFVLLKSGEMILQAVRTWTTDLLNNFGRDYYTQFSLNYRTDEYLKMCKFVSQAIDNGGDSLVENFHSLSKLFYMITYETETIMNRVLDRYFAGLIRLDLAEVGPGRPRQYTGRDTPMMRYLTFFGRVMMSTATQMIKQMENTVDQSILLSSYQLSRSHNVKRWLKIWSNEPGDRMASRFERWYGKLPSIIDLSKRGVGGVRRTSAGVTVSESETERDGSIASSFFRATHSGSIRSGQRRTSSASEASYSTAVDMNNKSNNNDGEDDSKQYDQNSNGFIGWLRNLFSS